MRKNATTISRRVCITVMCSVQVACYSAEAPQTTESGDVISQQNVADQTKSALSIDELSLILASGSESRIRRAVDSLLCHEGNLELINVVDRAWQQHKKGLVDYSDVILVGIAKCLAEATADGLPLKTSQHALIESLRSWIGESDDSVSKPAIIGLSRIGSSNDAQALAALARRETRLAKWIALMMSTSCRPEMRAETEKIVASIPDPAKRDGAIRELQEMREFVAEAIAECPIS